MNSYQDSCFTMLENAFTISKPDVWFVPQLTWGHLLEESSERCAKMS